MRSVHADGRNPFCPGLKSTLAWRGHMSQDLIWLDNSILCGHMIGMQSSRPIHLLGQNNLSSFAALPDLATVFRNLLNYSRAERRLDFRSSACRAGIIQSIVLFGPLPAQIIGAFILVNKRHLQRKSGSTSGLWDVSGMRLIPAAETSERHVTMDESQFCPLL